MKKSTVPFAGFLVLATFSIAPAAPPVWLSMKTDQEIETGVPLVLHVTVRSADLPPGSLTLIPPEGSWQVVEGPTSWSGTLRAGEKVQWDLTVIPLVDDREPFRVRFEAAGERSEWTAPPPAVRLNPQPGGGASGRVTLRGRAVYVDPSGAKIGIRHAKVKLWDTDWFPPCFFYKNNCAWFMGESETDEGGFFTVTGSGWDLGADLPDPYVEIVSESRAGWVDEVGPTAFDPWIPTCFASNFIDSPSDGSTFDIGDVQPNVQGRCTDGGDNSQNMHAWHAHNALRDAWDVLLPSVLSASGTQIPPLGIREARVAEGYLRGGLNQYGELHGDLIVIRWGSWNEEEIFATYAHHLLNHFAALPFSDYDNDTCGSRLSTYGACVWDASPASIPFIEGFSHFVALYIKEKLGKRGAELRLRSGNAGTGSFEKPPHPGQSFDFAHIEGYCAAVLWDLHDPVNPAEDHDRNGSMDLLEVPFDFIWRVMTTFRPTSIGGFFGGFQFLYPHLANSAAGIYDENHLRLPLGADLMASNAGVTPAQARRGDTIQLSGLLTNRGSLWSSDSTLQLYFSRDPIITTGDEPVGIDFLGVLTPGQSGLTSFQATLTPSAVPGKYWIGACANPYKHAYELDDANNCSSGVEFEILSDAPPPPPATACFSDDFSQAGALGRWTVVSGSWSLINGHLNTVAPFDSESWIWAGSPPVRARPDSSYSLNAAFLPRLGTGPVSHGGIMFCATNPSHRFDAGNSGYTVDWYGTGGPDGGLRLIRWDQGQPVILLSTGTLLSDPPRVWQIDFNGPLINVYGDGRRLLTATDATYRGGHFGLWSWVDQSVTFDDVRFLGRCEAPPPPPPPATPCFSDDFSGVNPMGSWTARSGSWSISGEALRTTTLFNDEAWIWAGNPPIPALRESGYSLWAWFDATLPFGVGRHGGVMFCAANPTNRQDPYNRGYTLDWIDRAENHGMRLSRWDGGVQTVLATGTPDLVDPPFSWQIAVDDQKISVYGDGVLLLEAQDSTYRGGYFAAWAWETQLFAVDEVRFLGDCRPPAPPPTDCFSDDFSQEGALRRWTIGGGRWSLGKGSLGTAATPESGGSWAWAGSPPVPGRPESGYAVRFNLPRLEAPSTGQAGIMLCAPKPGSRLGTASGYTVDWDGSGGKDGGFRLLRWDDGKPALLRSSGGRLSRPPREWQVAFAGPRIDVYGDGALLLSAEDSTYRGGHFALWSSMDQAVAFDDVRFLGRCDAPPTLPAPPLPPATDCFSDDFSRTGAIERWTQASGRWAVASEALFAASADGESWIWAGDLPATASGQSAYSFRMQFERASFPPEVGRHAGAMFCAKTPTGRFDPSNNGYTLDWIDRPADRGLRLLRIDAGLPTTLATGGQDLTHPPVLLQVAFEGEAIRIWGDGNLLLDARDGRYRGGLFGLWSWLQQAVFFDDVRFVGKCEAPPSSLQLAGDCNQDGRRDLSDSLCLLGHLFLSDPAVLPCGDGTKADPGNMGLLDHNGDRRIDISDGIAFLRFLFQGEAPPAAGLACFALPGCPEACASQ